MHWLLLPAYFILFSLQCPGEDGKVHLHFIDHAGNDLLKLDSANYKNQLGQEFTVSALKYYISNISLNTADGKNFHDGAVYLVNHEQPQSATITLESPASRYTSLTFTIGVDSARNCSGIQGGALDPLNGMFWTWNTGYIFFRLEGKAEVSHAAGHIIEYHIGGYRNPNNCIRQVTLPLTGEAAQDIYIKTDILKVFSGKSQVDFSVMPSVTGISNAVTVADNYTGMFSIIQP